MLWSTTVGSTYLFAELIGKGDEESPVAFSLVRREGEDTRQIVTQVRVLLFAEVTHRMEPVRIYLFVFHGD